MTTTPSNGHPGDSLPSERNKKTASGKRRRGDLDFIASWLTKMPLPNEPKKRPNPKAITTPLTALLVQLQPRPKA